MPQDAADELRQWQTQCLAALGAVIGVGQEDDAIAQAKRPLVWDGAPLGITSEIQDHATAMFVGWTDLDVEGLAVELFDLALPGAHIRARRQMQRRQGLPQGVEKLAAEELLQCLNGSQPVRSAVAPVAVRVEAAGTD